VVVSTTLLKGRRGKTENYVKVTKPASDARKFNTFKMNANAT
jgi:hypothetical protein